MLNLQWLICTYTCTCILRTLNNLQWQCIEGLVLHLVIVCNNDLYKSSINSNFCVECSVHSYRTCKSFVFIVKKIIELCITKLIKFLLCIKHYDSLFKLSSTFFYSCDTLYFAGSTLLMKLLWRHILKANHIKEGKC